MKNIRVLIVDDSVVIRKLVGDGLAQDPAIEVVGAAANGKIALQKIPQCNPDLVTLDIEMPEMDGLETLKHIRVDYPRLPVIMFSTLTERGASTTLEALSLGASDYVTKPANVGGINEGAKKIHDDLIPKIKSLCGYHAIVATSSLPTIPQVQRRPITVAPSPIRADRHVDIVAIGTSTGGPNALADVLPEFPKDFPVPIVIVQHMPPLFTKLLADRLNAKSSISVFEGQAGTVLQPGCAYLAPGDFHMTVERKAAQIVLGLNKEPFENSCRPAVDVLFRTVGEIYGDSVLAVIMTGMGQDGLRGCETIRGAGGQIVTQDEASSVVWGMPGFVTKAGLADCVLPLKEIAREIVRRTMKNRKLPQAAVLDASRVGIVARQG